jgi:hypothetical protein
VEANEPPNECVDYFFVRQNVILVISLAERVERLAQKSVPACKARERDKRATETRLRGWACEIRTQKRRRKLSL